MFGHADTLCNKRETGVHKFGLVPFIYLFDDVGAELLDGKSTNIARKLTDNAVTEAVIIEVQDVLDDLFDINRTRFQKWGSKELT